MTELISIIFPIIFAATGGYIFGYHRGLWKGSEDRAKLIGDFAVIAGKAEYYLDENNERQWRWK